MALFRKFFYRKPPEGLLEISERVYVFDCCFTTNPLEGSKYEAYTGRVVDEVREYFPDASFMVFSFGDGNHHKRITNILSKYNITLVDYPSHYESCPLLTVDMMDHFLRSTESWLCIGQGNVILMHCQNGVFPVLAFMLAAFLIYRKLYAGEKRTLDMVYKQASHEFMHLLSSIDPLPSQLRYLQYVSRRNIGSRWPPLDRALTLDRIILKAIPNMDGKGGCRPIFRIYGLDPLMAADRNSKMLFSTPKKSRTVGYYRQADCERVKIDINCHVQGDVVLECITLDDNLEHEEMMFRVMFNTAFIRSNVVMLNREEIDVRWKVKDQFPADFTAEILFSDMDSYSSSSLVGFDFTGIHDIEGLPDEAFDKVHDIFNKIDWGDSERDNAYNIIQQMTVSSILEEKKEISSYTSARLDRLPNVSKSVKDESLKSGSTKATPNTGYEAQKGNLSSVSIHEASPTMVETPKSKPLADPSETSLASSKSSPDLDHTAKKTESSELHVSVQRPAESKIISPTSSASYSNSSQGSGTALSRYNSAPSAVGITALLHEFNKKTMWGSVSSESSTPEKHPPEKHYISSESGSGGLPSPPPPAPPTMPLTAQSLIPQPQLKQPLPPSPSSIPPPLPTPPVQSQHEFHTSEVSSSLSKIPVSSSPQLSKLQPPPSQSLPPLTAPSPSPPRPAAAAAAMQSYSVLSSTPSSPSLTPSPSPITALPPPSTIETVKPTSLSSVPSPPPPPPPPLLSNVSIVQNLSKTIPPPPLPPTPLLEASTKRSTVPPSPPPPPPPQPGGSVLISPRKSSVPPPPCPPSLFQKELPDRSHQGVPPPPAPLMNASPRGGDAYFKLHSSASTLLDGKGKLQLRSNTRMPSQSKKTSLKPYHWLKLTRAVQGSLWAEAQKPEVASKAPELDMSELESLFSATAPKSVHGAPGAKTNRRGSGLKSDKIQLIELRRAYNCEIMLTKVKIPLSDLMNSVLALDASALDIDQVDNLIKFCPTKEEIELLKDYKGDKENLGKCEQFFMELMKVPRVESKLRVFSFTIQFHSQVSDLRNSLNIINSASEEVRNSVKLKRIMHTILQLGNALNHGTARGSAVGFRLDSLPKLAETRARNNKLTLIHYLCKVLAEKLPEVLDFDEDLVSIEASTKIQLKYLAEEMQAISKGLEKVVQELTASENDGAVSEQFCKTLTNFLGSAEAEVRSLASLYSGVGRNADALALYFGEDPARCPFEQVVSTLLNFVRMFRRAHEENCKQLELEKKKKAQEEASKGKVKSNTSQKELESNSLIETAAKTSEFQSQLYKSKPAS